MKRNERKLIQAEVARTQDGEVLRRGVALLRLDDGESLVSVAKFFLVSLQTIYNWISAFAERRDLNIVARLSEGVHSGRPRRLHGHNEPLLESALDSNPFELGHTSTIWTASLLARRLAE